MSLLEKYHILIVDDSQTIRNSISRFLGDSYVIHQARNGEEAWALIQSIPEISLVFADLNMPVMNGMALLKKVRGDNDKRIAELPVIMITGHQDTEAAKRASYSLGASEFISKPFCEFDIISRVETCIKLNRKIANLEKDIINDQLTGLYNTSGFNQLGEQALAASNRHEYDLSILSLQIANLADINNKYGKKVASQIVVSVANTMKKSLRKEEFLAHLGMGQFAMLMPLTKVYRAQIVAQRFYRGISNLVFKLGNNELRVNLALGINSTEDYPDHVSFTDLMQHTECAMQQSLNSQPFKMVRYDAALEKMFSSTLNTNLDVINSLETSSATQQNEQALAQQGFQILNTQAFSRYMSMILNGQFNKIPKQDLRILAQPLKDFMRYVEQQEVDNTPPEKLDS